MLASGWQIGKLMNSFDISDLTAWEHEMFEAHFWRDGYVSKAYTFSPATKPWTNVTLGLFDDALMELWYK